jgi:cytochrome b561
MPLWNARSGYGAAPRFLHWAVVLLFAAQFAGGLVMTRLAPGTTQDALYNGHKTLGLVALALAVLRLAARRIGQLPDWAPCLSDPERRFAHRAEQGLYAGMFLLPLSGLLHVMAGGYGVLLFGLWPLPNPLPRLPSASLAASWTHAVAGALLAAAIAGHVGLVLRHTLLRRDGLLWRMWPRRAATGRSR